ncbi:ubiquinone/menaquinone biosynthesis C-methylase UbiE [Brevibacterium paucivorans]|uniref:Ubiquinone/menaquinone biosynthesis C-methylase UbiE n=1 Tax=Brevibacterium paucivorans TaxID=170994 RepID=A0ABS2SHJ6_9MICO|nr:class I SAM-dependent methyltransferase [Brevibacterium paucivorans]MBM7815702.1 ubiquinone/menaquinone biosynthesis C-methylase UbiE [Brevibacterium paucivorans]MBM7815720.1 ubiquinone/menaquinone biosynthesis C-methylase UbiE [Brevibacterium paucivorans]
MEKSIQDGWNHNRHYHNLILEQCRPSMHTALDVGCGEGLLAQALSARGLIVTAIDACDDVLAIARRREHGIRWVHGDVMIHDFGEQQFDLVTAVATVHHLPEFEVALARLRSLVSPGGTLVILGLARSATTVDFVYDVVGAVQHRFYAKLRDHVEDSAPKKFEFPLTYRQVRTQARSCLPGCSFRRLPLFRYLLVWNHS